MERPLPYCAYLIRLWPTKRRGVTGCRVSLQCVDSGQRKDFPDLEDLLAFLEARADQMDQIPKPSES